jgi:hypothetical protein
MAPTTNDTADDIAANAGCVVSCGSMPRSRFEMRTEGMARREFPGHQGRRSLREPSLLIRGSELGLLLLRRGPQLELFLGHLGMLSVAEC